MSTPEEAAAAWLLAERKFAELGDNELVRRGLVPGAVRILRESPEAASSLRLHMFLSEQLPETVMWDIHDKVYHIPALFNWDKLAGNLAGNERNFRELERLLDNNEVIAIHLGPEPADADPLGKLLHGTPGVLLERARMTFRRQMAVLTATFVEKSLGSYLQALFSRHPSRMHQFIGAKDSPGVLRADLKTVVLSRAA